MTVGVQFQGTIAAGETRRWYTVNWPAQWHVIWHVVPNTPTTASAPQIDWDVEVERASGSDLTYWITVTNLSSAPVDFEARYAIMN